MSERDAAIAGFIERAGWGTATVAPLAGDASNRRYLRLRRDGDAGRAVLMDAPAQKGEDVRPFIHIASYLSGLGLSAPRILAADPQEGLLLLEDLGDDLFARIIPRHPELENSLYSCATDVLIDLHRHSPPENLSRYSVPVMTDLAALACDWYMAHATCHHSAAADALREAMTDCLTHYAPDQTVLIQRDYHSENLLWLPDRSGIARVGLLDFQDAMLGHPAYDLLSLLQDARRDVPPEIEREMITRYMRATAQDEGAFIGAYHALGAQRNLRILGVFARLCLRDGKAHYVDLIPRVWGLLQRDLAHPGLYALAHVVHEALPAPTDKILQKLKDQCATIPDR